MIEEETQDQVEEKSLMRSPMDEEDIEMLSTVQDPSMESLKFNKSMSS